MEIAKIIYQGKLRTEATHLASGTTILSDAPTDNHGRGEAFSPTDLLATSLGSCMLTIMGISAEKNEIPLHEVEIRISKYMAANPRRVEKIGVTLRIRDEGLSGSQKKMLETAALNCPVAKSLHPDLVQDVQFIYH